MARSVKFGKTVVCVPASFAGTLERSVDAQLCPVFIVYPDGTPWPEVLKALDLALQALKEIKS